MSKVDLTDLAPVAPVGEVRSNSISDQLKDLGESLGVFENFETQRRNIGAAYRAGNDIREASKDGVVSLKRGDGENFRRCVADAKRAWDDLIHLRLPADLAWQHEAEAGMEYVELVFVGLLYPLLQDQSATVSNLPSFQDLLVTPQTWLAGIGDATTELSKMTNELLLNPELSREDRIKLHRRYLEIARELYDFLERHETVYAMVINNSRRRGYGNTFRGLLQRVERVINYRVEALVAIFDRDAK